MKWFVRRDIDGFFGLAIDNLIQLLLVLHLCQVLVGIPAAFVYERILPGAALSLLLGNLFYAWQAVRIGRRLGRDDMTALPYGINTVSLFAYLLFIMAPVYRETGDWRLAWQLGVLACLFSGLIELLGAFVAERLRRATPRAALLASLAGIAIGFISMDFALRTWTQPVLALLPLGVILIQYFSRIRFPFGLPGGLVAVALGTAVAWAGGMMDAGAVGRSAGTLGFYPPAPALDAFALLGDERIWGYLSVILPMGLFNLVGSLQNIESAEAAGDRYPTAPSLAVNGLGSMVAACFGSCFPTTIYIGHPGWKGLGARAGYSWINGAFFMLACLTGSVALINAVVPLEAGIAIVFWIGIVIGAQAFQVSPRRHAPAIAVGLFPALAGWGLLLVQQAIGPAGDLGALVEGGILNGGLPGMLALSQGAIFSSMILAAVCVFIIDRRFVAAAIWTAGAAVLAFFGVLHAYRIRGADVLNDFGFDAGRDWAIGYALVAVLLALTALWVRRSGQDTPPPQDDDAAAPER
jgi:AGZA family xanthine/uracil permease-like MFS transporter